MTSKVKAPIPYKTSLCTKKASHDEEVCRSYHSPEDRHAVWQGKSIPYGEYFSLQKKDAYRKTLIADLQASGKWKVVRCRFGEDCKRSVGDCNFFHDETDRNNEAIAKYEQKKELVNLKLEDVKAKLSALNDEEKEARDDLEEEFAVKRREVWEEAATTHLGWSLEKASEATEEDIINAIKFPSFEEAKAAPVEKEKKLKVRK
jgi:hypothetical protein